MENKSYLLASYHIQDFGVKGLSDLALAEKKKWQILKEKRNLAEVDGLFYLQTCNRIEFLYCFKNQNIDTIDMDQYFPALSSRVYSDLGEITEHLLSVCLSKDSMVFGENQILGQFKAAYQESVDQSLLNKDLSNLLKWIIQEAKGIRSQLPFKHFPDSISSLAARKIQQDHSNDARILLVGAGETNELVAKHLLKRSFKDITFVNRTYKKAANLAEATETKALPLENLAELKDYDAIVCATSCKDIIIKKEHLESLKPKTAIDLSLPINICKDSCLDKNVKHYDVASFREDLSEVKKESQKFLWDLQKKIIEGKNKILAEWNLFNKSQLICDFRSYQQQNIQSVMAELKQSEINSETLLSIEKQLKKLCHEQILELRKRVVQNDYA